MREKISGRPNKEQRRFILRRLIPAILREQGRAFAMETWFEVVREDVDGNRVIYDEITRAIPNCGSVCCIGGTAQALLNPKGTYRNWNPRTIRKLAKSLGLTAREAHGLFFNWETDTLDSGICGWPEQFQEQFARRRTTLGKANVAARLLHKIADEGGKCLHTQRDTKS